MCVLRSRSNALIASRLRLLTGWPNCPVSLQTPVEAAFIAHRVVPIFLDALKHNRSVWTQRSVAKALCVLQRREALVAAAAGEAKLAVPAYYATIQSALDAAGKADFVCQRWARESGKWQADTQVAAAAAPVAPSTSGAAEAAPAGPRQQRRKKWYED